MTTNTYVEQDERPIKSIIPWRMDKMPWAKFHWMVILGLGTAWILDGLEVQLVATAGFQKTLDMSSWEVGLAGTIYLLGQVTGALIFGRLTDAWGRKKLFILTLLVYLIGSGIAGFAWNVWWLYIWRFVAGMGIGGEYAAINSAIDELIPGKYRGRVDLAINGTYWAGALLASLLGFWLLNPDHVAQDWGWRIAFWIGPFLGLIIIFLRRNIPESPRWMVTHGQAKEAEEVVDRIEESVRGDGKELPDSSQAEPEWIKAREGLRPRELAYVFFKMYPTRTILGATLMITQSFLYNAIFFTYALVLKNFYGLSESATAIYFIPFAIGNLAGPLLLGHFFDTVGRRKMIFGTYFLAGLVLLVSAFMFKQDMLSPFTHTMLWCVAFFFASAGASAGYLTVSEIFPLEVRGQAISYFFSVAQVFGALGPVFYGWLIGEGKERDPMFWGYVLASVIMWIGAAVAMKWGVDAEGKALEEIAPPITSYDEQGNMKSRLPEELRR